MEVTCHCRRGCNACGHPKDKRNAYYKEIRTFKALNNICDKCNEPSTHGIHCEKHCVERRKPFPKKRMRCTNCWQLDHTAPTCQEPKR